MDPYRCSQGALPGTRGQSTRTTFFDEKLCLNLNVNVHEDTLNQAGKSTGVGIMVYIHRGAYRDDGGNLVRQSVALGRTIILVVPNYRLNFFGNFSCPELVADLASNFNLNTSSSPSDGTARSTGNWGLQDQRLAFEWVRDHISTMGGELKNTIAFVESIGAASVQYHMVI
ncbi:hypothetical protein BGZ50_007803 [Haplosporangium sp. Z 11]|nr:hypothetical protein BGZ50_007803 [Haplosporangium sp. Z 11]